MNKRVKRRLTVRGTIAALALCTTWLPATAVAQSSPNAWQFRAILYGYFPDIGGSTIFSTRGGTGTGGANLPLSLRTGPSRGPD